MEGRSDLPGIARLKEEEERALQETRGKLQQWQTFDEDYTALQTRLSSLPDKVSHQIMVPFGKLAFMPGRLVHTNEILVLLGDNWFAERSAKQACDIVCRRKKYVNEMMDDLKKQQYLLESRLGFVTDMKESVEGRGDTVEIREDYDAEKEAQWKKEHLIRRREATLAKKSEAQGSQSSQGTGSFQSQDKAQGSGSSQGTGAAQSQDTAQGSGREGPSEQDLLWARLDELERQEEELDELEMTDEDDNGEDTDNLGTVEEGGDVLQTQPFTSVPGRETSGKHVHWKEDEEPQPPRLNLKDDQEDGDGDDDDESNSSPVIHFSHSRVPSMEFSRKEEGKDLSPRSPGEIYEQHQARIELREDPGVAPRDGPKSILKQSRVPAGVSPGGSSGVPPGMALAGAVPAELQHSSAEQPAQSSHSSVSNATKVQPLPAPLSAFTGSVVEHGHSGEVKSAGPLTPVNTQSATSNGQGASGSTQGAKRVSRFKAARQGKR